MNFKRFFADIKIEVTLYDTLPDIVACMAIAYHTQCMHKVLKHWYNPARVRDMTYSNRPTFDWLN